MTPRQLEQYLQSLLQEALETRDILGGAAPTHGYARTVGAIASIETFEQAELLTNDKGLVIITEDGVEFRLSISRRPATRDVHMRRKTARRNTSRKEPNRE